MPSSNNYKRDYKQERRTAKKRGETGRGSNSGDAKRHRARRKKLKGVKNKSKYRHKEVHHKRSIKSGGGNAKSNLRWGSRRTNRKHGGRIGNRRGKAAGARKGHRSGKR